MPLTINYKLASVCDGHGHLVVEVTVTGLAPVRTKVYESDELRATLSAIDAVEIIRLGDLALRAHASGMTEHHLETLLSHPQGLSVTI